MKPLPSRLTGNAILRRTHHSHYTDGVSAARIGAVSGIFIPLAFGLLALIGQYFDCGLFAFDSQELLFLLPTILALASGFSNSAGAAILHHCGVELGGIDILHAAWAGVLGGTIIAVGTVVVIIILLLLSSVICSLYDAAEGLYERQRLQQVRVETENPRRSSLCDCIGCGCLRFGRGCHGVCQDQEIA